MMEIIFRDGRRRVAEALLALSLAIPPGAVSADGFCGDPGGGALLVDPSPVEGFWEATLGPSTLDFGARPLAGDGGVSAPVGLTATEDGLILAAEELLRLVPVGIAGFLDSADGTYALEPVTRPLDFDAGGAPLQALSNADLAVLLGCGVNELPRVSASGAMTDEVYSYEWTLTLIFRDAELAAGAFVATTQTGGRMRRTLVLTR